MLALATLRNLGTKVAGRTLIVEIDTDLALLPLLEVTHDAAPLALTLNRKGVLIVGRTVRLKAEHLDACPRRLVHNHTRTNNLRVVEDQQ